MSAPTRNCHKCGVPLVTGENITQNQIDNRAYICRDCLRDQHRDYRYRTGRSKPMSENMDSALFLGVHIAERVLSHVFKDVQRMPLNNPGYDVVCRHGFKIDINSTLGIIF